MAKVLVIGLDGGTWNIMKSLVKEGHLPTIAKIMKRGCYGDLESCMPPVTSPAWKCYSTGKNPGKLGVYWQLCVDLEKQKFIAPNATSFKSKEIWDYLSERGISCGVLDMPTTYPPKRILGFMVSYGPPKPTGFTYPKDLENTLKSLFNYKTDPDYFFDVNIDKAISSYMEIINQR